MSARLWGHRSADRSSDRTRVTGAPPAEPVPFPRPDPPPPHPGQRPVRRDVLRRWPVPGRQLPPSVVQHGHRAHKIRVILGPVHHRPIDHGHRDILLHRPVTRRRRSGRTCLPGPLRVHAVNPNRPHPPRSLGHHRILSRHRSSPGSRQISRAPSKYFPPQNRTRRRHRPDGNKCVDPSRDIIDKSRKEAVPEWIDIRATRSHRKPPIRGHFQRFTHFCPFRHGLAQLQRLNGGH